ncbi:MAG: hypothetical protein LT080_15315 [Thiobacillus sp.]|nr:hypothetical protein [Thiobacillus sp.]
MKRFIALVAAWLLAAPALAADDVHRPNPDQDPKTCAACHTRIYDEWKSSAMGHDLDNPKVYQFYTATNPKGEKDGLGYQGMFPGKAGDCADCHVPVQVIDAHKAGKEVDLGHAMANKTDHGISCYFCHSMKEAKIEKDAEGKYKTRIFDSVTLDQESGSSYGPRKGVKAPHPVVETQLHKSSNVCASCHLNQEKHLSISTYDDWNRYFTAGKVKQTCQECHMPLHKNKQELAIGGAKRSGVRAHTFVGARDSDMLKKALSLKTALGKTPDGKLLVRATVENVGAGHKVPGSGPIRNVILKIDAWDETGKPLVFAGPDSGKLHPLAGMGNPKTGARDENDWAGLPGKMYAKIFASKPNPQTGKPMLGVGGFAADTVVLDNGLEPFAPDTSEYQFELPEGVKGIKVRAKLAYRYAFKPIVDRKGWSLDERPSFMAENTLNLAVGKLKTVRAAVPQASGSQAARLK